MNATELRDHRPVFSLPGAAAFPLARVGGGIFFA